MHAAFGNRQFCLDKEIRTFLCLDNSVQVPDQSGKEGGREDEEDEEDGDEKKKLKQEEIRLG